MVGSLGSDGSPEKDWFSNSEKSCLFAELHGSIPWDMFRKRPKILESKRKVRNVAGNY